MGIHPRGTDSEAQPQTLEIPKLCCKGRARTLAGDFCGHNEQLRVSAEPDTDGVETCVRGAKGECVSGNSA